jgi:hypothetical protein
VVSKFLPRPRCILITCSFSGLPLLTFPPSPGHPRSY